MIYHQLKLIELLDLVMEQNINSINKLQKHQDQVPILFKQFLKPKVKETSDLVCL